MEKAHISDILLSFCNVFTLCQNCAKNIVTIKVQKEDNFEYIFMCLFIVLWVTKADQCKVYIEIHWRLFIQYHSIASAHLYIFVFPKHMNFICTAFISAECLVDIVKCIEKPFYGNSLLDVILKIIIQYEKVNMYNNLLLMVATVVMVETVLVIF